MIEDAMKAVAEAESKADEELRAARAEADKIRR